MIRVYYGRNRHGRWRASPIKSKVANFSDISYEDISEPIHLNKLYMIKTYFGFDYDYSTGRVHNRYAYSQLYHSVMAAKKDDRLIEAEMLANRNPEGFLVESRMISTNCGGEPFFDGDIMEGNFNTEIITVPVIY